MRAKGDILLISCYELGHQPLHLATLTGLLEQNGYRPLPVDSAIEPPGGDLLACARFIAIAVPMHTALRLGEQVARRARALNPHAFICFYGLYAQLNADHLLQTVIDAAIGGEYELPLLQLIRSCEQDDNAMLATVAASLPRTGTTTQEGVTTRTHTSKAWIQRAPTVKPQRRQLPPLERYARLQWHNELRLAGYTESTRGCKHSCLHCPITPIYQGRFFAVPRDIVLHDIREQVRQGATHITFGDPDFWNGPTHALRIVRAMHEEFPTLTFDATIKIEHLLQHRALLPEMKECGCLFIVSAIESLNETTLKHLNKGHTAEDVAIVFEEMECVGIALRPSLLPFTPWETLESYDRLLRFFEERHLVEHIDPIHLSIRLLIPPGSALLETPEDKPWLQELDAAAYTYRWQHPDPRMDELQALIATVVDEAEKTRADTLETFFHIVAMTHAALGETFVIEKALKEYGARKILPHLTEAWFC